MTEQIMLVLACYLTEVVAIYHVILDTSHTITHIYTNCVCCMLSLDNYFQLATYIINEDTAQLHRDVYKLPLK